MCALVRACVNPTSDIQEGGKYTIYDLGQIVSTSTVPEDFNIGLLQRSQIPWLFFLARHYCDIIAA
jgi:hypothetical protein